MSAPVPTTASAKLLAESTSDKTRADYTGVPNTVASAQEQDRTYFAPLTVSGASVFKYSKSATTALPEYVSPGEEYTYAIGWANASQFTYSKGSFVDVLPFDGDSRGTAGLSGALKLVAAQAESNKGDVTIEYTTDASATVQQAVAIPGNESAETGVTWKKLDGSVPAGVTALRFTPPAPLAPGDSGNATIV